MLAPWKKSYDQPAVAAAAKSLQSCPNLCEPRDGSPPGSSVSGILQAKILEWVAISFSNAWKWKAKVKSLSRALLLATPWTAAYQAPPSMGFSRQEYWSGVPLPSPQSTLHRFIYIGWSSPHLCEVQNSRERVGSLPGCTASRQKLPSCRSEFPVDSLTHSTGVFSSRVCHAPLLSHTLLWVSLGPFLEKEMATYSSALTRKTPWMEEPGGLQSMRSQRVGHNWSNLAHSHTGCYELS